MTPTTTESMAMTARRHHRPNRNFKASPPHPGYEDDISADQLDVIRRLADPDGTRANKRVILYPSLV